MRIKKEMAGELLDRFVVGMKELGFSKHDIITLVTDSVNSDPRNKEEV